MSDSIPWIIIPTTWVDVYALSGIDVGTAVEIANMGTAEVNVCVHPTAPTTSTIGITLQPAGLYGMAAYVPAGASGLWAMAMDSWANNFLSVQEKV